MDKKKVIAFISLIIIVVLWGVTPVLGKYCFNNGFDSPALLVAIRGLIAAITMAIYLLITKGFKDINKKYLITIPAGLILASAYLFQFIGLETTTTAKNTFLESFSVVAAPITVWIILKERPGVSYIIASILCLGGAFILCGDGWNFTELLKAPSLGDIFSMIGGALFGVNIGFTQKYAKDKNPFLYVFFQMAILAVVSFIYALIFERPLLFAWNYQNILIVLFLSIFCMAICWIVRAFAVRHVNAVTIAVMNPMSAVIATVISIAIGQEKFNYNLLVGGLIIVIAILISSLSSIKKDKMSRESV